MDGGLGSNTGLDSGFEVWAMEWTSGSWHEGLGPGCRSESLMEAWVLGWALEDDLGARIEVWDPDEGLSLGWKSGPLYTIGFWV